jgi:signal transduction histidine kinase
LWTPRQYLGELGRVFADIERRFDFLAEIDRQITNQQSPFQTKFQRLVRQFAFRLAGADAAAICFPTTTGFSIQILDGRDHEPELVSTIKSLIDGPLVPGEIVFKRTSKFSPLSSAAILMPIGTPEKDLFAILVALTTKGDVSHSHLKDATTRDYAKRVLLQLSILIQTELKWRDGELHAKFIQSFLDSKLDRETTITRCLESVREAIPDWEYAAESKSEVLVQMLSYHGDNQPLTIDAQVHPGSFTEKRNLVETDIGKPVSIQDSVTGTLVRDYLKDPTISLRNIDPTTAPYKDLYKAFLGNTTPHSELMIAMTDHDGLVGILNLEHPAPLFFSAGAERAGRHAAASLAPIIRELNRTFEVERKRQSATLYAMFGFLDRLSQTFRHKVGQSDMLIGKRLRDLPELIDARDFDGAKIKLQELAKYTDEYINHTNLFMAAAPHYIGRGSRDLRVLVQGALREVKSTVSTDAPIDFEFVCEGDPHVYASDMLQEHFYNLFNNSVYSIKVRFAKKGIERGLLRIAADVEDVTDSVGTNTVGQRVRIRITDNGTGADKDFLPKIGDYSVTTKGAEGTGFGVFAAKDYVRSVGGRLQVDNVEVESGKIQGFKVEMFLDVFDPTRHKEEQFGQRR